MKVNQGIGLGLSALFAAATMVCTPAAAQQPPAPQPPPQQQQQKPNILFIMGDDIGWMQPSIYHQGLMVKNSNAALLRADNQQGLSASGERKTLEIPECIYPGNSRRLAQ